MKKMKTIAWGCALAIAGAMTARGVVIFDDQFTSGTRTGAGYYISNTSNGASASVSGGFLVWEKASSGGSDPSVVWKNFTSYNLSSQPDGTFLRLNLGGDLRDHPDAEQRVPRGPVRFQWGPNN